MRHLNILILMVLLALSACAGKKTTSVKNEEQTAPTFIRIAFSSDYVTNQDGVQMVVAWLDAKRELTDQPYEKQVEFLVNKHVLDKTDNIATQPEYYLTKGALAKMVLRGLDVGSGLFWNVFGGEMHAFRECQEMGLMAGEGSDLQKVTGGELLAVINRASNYGKSPDATIEWDSSLPEAPAVRDVLGN